MVENVKEVGLELQRHSFLNPEFLGDSEVGIDKSWADQCISACWAITEESKILGSRAGKPRERSRVQETVSRTHSAQIGVSRDGRTVRGMSVAVRVARGGTVQDGNGHALLKGQDAIR